MAQSVSSKHISTVGTLSAPQVTAPTVLQLSNPDVLTVGAGMEFSTLGAALKVAVAGDTIAVQAGTYTNDFGTVSAAVSIIAVGGLVHEVATTPPPDDKGILTVNANLTIQGFTFTGGSDGSPDGNVSGIRLEAGNLNASYCSFYNMQEGMLADTNATGVVDIDHCSFMDNGTGDGFTHNLYIGEVQSLTVTNSFFEGANVGHEIKSRAAFTTITNNVIVDGPTGTGSYDIDVPNAGVAVISNNVIEKGPDASNVFAIHYGGETQIAYTQNSLSVTNNTIINDMPESVGWVVYNQSSVNGASVSAQIQNNQLYNFAANQISLGAANISGNTNLTSNPGYSTQSPLAALPQVSLAAGPEVLSLINGGNSVTGGVNQLTVTDTAGSNTISGGAGGLVATATAGWDQINTAAGASDTISTPGRSSVVNSHGNDRIIANGNYEVIQATGHATITGAGFNIYDLNGTGETLSTSSSGFLNVGAAGNGHVLDQAGDLTLTVATGGHLTIQDAAQTVNGGIAATATVTGGASSGTIGNSGTITIATGSQGSTILAGTGAVSVTGGSGNDVLVAGSGNDMFTLGGGTDRVVLGSGAASITSGAGADRFVFNNGSHGNDTISGFSTTADTLAFNGFAGNAIASGAIVGGSTLLTLTDGTTVDLVNVALPGYPTQTGGGGGGTSGGGGTTPPTGPTVGSGTLTTSGNLVTGGATLLTVVDQAGSNSIVGGAGGMVVTADDSDVLSTQAGSSNQLSLTRFDTLTGAGSDQVTVHGYSNLITEAGAANVSLLGGSNTVLGGASLLQVTDAVGGDSITGGAGGLNAALAGGYDTVTTAACATDVVSLAASSTMISQGSDQITMNGLYDAITVTGASSITAGAGYSTYVLDGADTLTSAGAGVATIGQTGSATIISNGVGGINVTKLAGGILALNQAETGGVASVTVSGGAASCAAVGGLYAADYVTVSGGDSVNAGAGSATITSTAALGSAADTIQAGSGLMLVTSGAVGLNLMAGSGNVTLNGGTGNDVFTGGSGQAQLLLGNGADTITFGNGASTVHGGIGDMFQVAVGSHGTASILNWSAQDSFAAPSATSAAITSDSVIGGSSFLTFAGGAQVELVGVTHLT